MARNCFGARNGYLLLETDYRQIELVEAANNSNDPTMVAMFLSGRDFHDQTAELLAPYIWKISPEEYAKLSKEDRKAKRRVAKTTNFAIHYDTEPEHNLARELDTTIAEARRVVEAVTGVFPVLKARMAEVLERARKEGGIRIRWQGKPANWRNLPGLGETSDSMRGIRRNAENAAWNGIIQGSAGHFATASLYPLQQAFDDLGIDAEVLFPVHDSIMVEVAEKHLRDAALVTRQVMTSWKSGAVPLSVDQKYGTHWGSMAALE
jgi:DNA polymerase-1